MFTQVQEQEQKQSISIFSGLVERKILGGMERSRAETSAHRSDAAAPVASSNIKGEDRSAASEQQVSQRGRSYPRGETR